MEKPEMTYAEYEYARQKKNKDSDAVENPSHYNTGNIETIDYIVDVLGSYDSIHYCHGNVLKYLGSRLWNKNNPLEDAKKARWYLNKMIALMEETQGTNW
jgi:hypothetical protein